MASAQARHLRPDTNEPRENRGEGRAAASIIRAKWGKAAGLSPQGKAPPRPNRAKRKAPARLYNARKLQRTLYRVAKQQPERRFTLLYDKVCRQDILREAWQRVKSNKGAAGVDEVDIDEIREYGEARFLGEIERELRDGSYWISLVRRVHIPKPGQPGGACYQTATWQAVQRAGTTQPRPPCHAHLLQEPGGPPVRKVQHLPAGGSVCQPNERSGTPQGAGEPGVLAPEKNWPRLRIVSPASKRNP